MNDKLEYALEITLTDECNFRCNYCFEGDSCEKNNSLDSVDDVFSAIDKMFADEWFSSKFDKIRIGFWGGEPTLRPDLIESFVERYKGDDRINFHIYTNGYEIEDLMRIFEPIKDRIIIQVSYDGKAIHDINRNHKDGYKTSEHVKSNIYELHNNGFTVGVKSTVPYDNLQYMKDCYDDIKSINKDLGRGISYTITLDYFNSIEVDFELLRKSFIEIAKKDLQFFEENGYHLFSRFNTNSQVTCGFFNHGMCIDTNGDLMYCHGCGYSSSKSDLTFGNIKDDDLLEKIKHNFSFFVNPKTSKSCKDCFVVSCVPCNAAKYDKSEKDSFLDRWYDFSCQKEFCDVYKEISKISIALKDIIRRK